MGRALGRHALRIAVKDRETNDLMHAILKRTLTELGAAESFVALVSSGA